MKVSDLYTTINQIIHHHHNVIPTLTLCDTFQNYVQKCKAEHHFRTGAGSSVVSSLKAEIKALTVQVQVSSPERNTVNSINECTTLCTSTCTSLQFLKRHAKCLALLVGWVETTYAVMGRNDSTCNPYEANINAVSFQQELASLVNVIVDLVSADLKVMLALMAGAKSSGGIVFHSVNKVEVKSCNMEVDLDDNISESPSEINTEGSSEWYREDVECCFRIALLLPIVVLHPHGIGDVSSQDGTALWTKLLLRTLAPDETLSELRALCYLLQAYTGVSASRQTRTFVPLSLHYSELSSSTPSSPSHLKLSSHESLLLLRMGAQHTQLSPHGATIADIAGGAGDYCFENEFTLADIDELGGVSVSPQAVVFRMYPRFCCIGEGSNDAWPGDRGLQHMLRCVLSGLASESDTIDNKEREVADINPKSFYALLNDWQDFVFPFHAYQEVERLEVGHRGKRKEEKKSFEDGDSMLSSVILQIGRLATKVESTPEGGFEISPGPPSVVPRAVVHVLSSYTHDSTLKGVDHARFPLQTGALVLVVNTCCDLIGVSYQASRQVECLSALYMVLMSASSAVLTQLAAWALPKLMQIMDVVTEATPKYCISRCLQVLFAALPRGSAMLSSQIDDSSQLHLRYAHQLILKTCRDMHLHPSELKTEAYLFALQPFLCICPIGVLLAQTQPLTEALCAVIAANTASVMEAIGNVLLGNYVEEEGTNDKTESKVKLSKDDKKSMRLVMHGLRSLCLLCRRCPLQMKALSQLILLAPLRMYLIMHPLSSTFESSLEQELEQDGECGLNDNDDDRIMTGYSVRKGSDPVAIVGGTTDGSQYCQWLWLSVCSTCRAVKATCPEEWVAVTHALTIELSTEATH